MTKVKKVVRPYQIALAALAVIVLIAAAVLLIMGGGDDSSANLVLLDTGNRGGNLSNGGTVLAVGDDIFISEPGTGQILKTSAGETSGAPVGNLRGRYLNSDGTNLWYVDQDSGMLMKSDLHGAEPVEFISSKVSLPTLMGDYIYFIDVGNNYVLSRIRKDGSEPAQILDGSARVHQYAIIGEDIFYTNLNDEGYATYISLDGADRATASSMYMGQVLFSQANRLYYTNQQLGGVLDCYSIDTNGNYGQPASSQSGTAFHAGVNTGIITCAVADDEHVYYVKATDGCMYRRNIQAQDASSVREEKLTEAAVYGLQDAGSHIYYHNVTGDGAFCVYAKN